MAVISTGKVQKFVIKAAMIEEEGCGKASHDGARVCLSGFANARRCYVPEIIRIGSLELRFLRSKHDTNGSLDLFEMTVPPSGRVPVPHYHRDWDETVYGLTGVLTFTAKGTPHDIGPGASLFIQRGASSGSPAGAGTTCFRISSATKIISWARARRMASAANCGSKRRACIGICFRHSAPPQHRPASSR